MNKDVNEINVEEWLKNNLSYDPFSSTRLNEIYQIYQGEVAKQNQVPYSKREFYYRMRKFFKSWKTHRQNIKS